jgi:colanic acid/amylovoran biosynthesis glycosyltransferase
VKNNSPDLAKNTAKALNQGPIAYILQAYPNLTMTFIYREVVALLERGFTVSVFSVWKPAKDKISPESRHLMDNTHYIFPISWRQFFVSHLYFLITRPLKYIGTFLFVMTRKGERRENRMRTVYHFGEAVYISRAIKNQNIKHLHAHFAHNAASIALIVSRLLDISFSFTAHNILFTDQIILKEKIQEALFIVAISQFTKQFITNLVPGVDQKIHIVRCGLSPADFLPPVSKLSSNLPLILFVAQLAERKGTPVLVEACKILVERNMPFQCVIIGNGPQWPLVNQLIEQYNLQDVIKLTGALFQEQVKEYLNQADIFVMPCIRTDTGDMDGIPVALMEAMAMEIATVSTYVSGIPELIENEQSGLLVPERDAAALANALQRLIQDSPLRIQLGKNGRKKVIQEFDIHQSAEQLAILFESYTKN